MDVGIIGSGYVGLVSGACLSEVGHNVICQDVSKEKIRTLLLGGIPIYEPGLETLIQKNISEEKLHFTNDLEYTVENSDVLFIAVGTPPQEDGSADLSHVLDVAKGIGEVMNDYKIIVTKSTVPVGTSAKVKACIKEELKKRDISINFDVASNPEFLKEGAAIDDFMKPDRIVIGVENDHTGTVLRQIYAPFTHNLDNIITMDIVSSELTKYAANSMLATKISLMNEISNVADAVGADIENVRKGIGSDPRIGHQFIYPGCGYGGSCFPKDVRALSSTAKENGYTTKILNAVEEVNLAQKSIIYTKIQKHYTSLNETISNNRIFGIWGLSFKPNTDDIREAPSMVLIDSILINGGIVQVYDPEAMDEIKKVYGSEENIVYCKSAKLAAKGADALVLVTEWKEFWSVDFEKLKKRMKGDVIFDGRNIWNPEEIVNAGFTYYGIGRNFGNRNLTETKLSCGNFSCGTETKIKEKP